MINLIGTLRDLVASVLGIGVDVETIAVDVAGLDGDAMRGTDDATLQATWTDAMATDLTAALAAYTVARAAYLDELAAANIPSDIDDLLARLTAARAGYLDELAAANLPSDVDDLLSDVGITAHQDCARIRVYPRVPSAVVQIASAAAADTFGSWTQVVPITTIDFEYQIVGVMVEQVGAGGTYIIQFGFSTADGTDPVTAQIVGEQRWVALGTPLKSFYADLFLRGMECPANAKLWARTMTENVAADTCDISITVTRHIETSIHRDHLTTWPWA